MASSDTVRKEYNADATSYDGIQLLPIGKLESQLFAAALGDATGATILDLGGGTGLKARQALDSGAASVDIVDISSEMLNTGRGIEVKQGQPKIRWFEGDASKPLDHLELGQYGTPGSILLPPIPLKSFVVYEPRRSDDQITN